MDIEIAKDRLFQSKQSMELSDLVTGKPIEEDVKLAIETIDTVLNYIEELENKLKIQTENYLSAMEDINWFCGKRTGQTVETALILRKEILKLPEGRTYGIIRCKNNIICVIPEEVTLNSKVRDKIEELENRNYNDFTREQDGNEVKYSILKEFEELLEEEI